MNIEIVGDDALAKFVRLLEQAGKGKARQAMSRALNDAGDKGRTQVRRALVKQTGMKYGWVIRGMKTRRASANSLAYTISESGDETNLREFGAKWLRPGVRAYPWGHSRIFTGSFLVPSRGNKVFVRQGAKRLPIKPLYGPNLGREVVKDQSREAFERIAPKLQPAIERAVMHEFGL